MTVEQMKETYDKVDKAIEAKNFLAECCEDTQLTFDRSGFRGELYEQLSVFSWFCCKRLCEKGIKAIIICIVEAIAVATALSMDAPQWIELFLIAISPVVSKIIVDRMEREQIDACVVSGIYDRCT